MNDMVKEGSVLIEVFNANTGHREERFLLQYSKDEYPNIDNLRARIEIGLSDFIKAENLDARVAYTSLQLKGIVGQFITSQSLPAIQRMPTIFVGLSHGQE